MELRPYQKDALAAVVDALKEGIRQQMLVLFTGAGKTVIAAQLPSVLKEAGYPGKMLFVAHRTELLTQAVDKIRLWNPTLRVGLEQAQSHADPSCDVIVACSASIGRANSTRMSSFWDDISVIVIDEVHHAAADSYLNIIEDSGVLLPDSKKILVGITATPKRRDRKRTDQTGLLDAEDLISLKSLFKKISYTYTLRKAIKDGWASPLKGFRVSTDTNLDDVKVVAGEFQIDQLSAAVNTPERNARIVRAWKENASGRQTLVFTCDIKHAQDLSEAFLHNGVLAQPISGADPKRAEKLAWFEAGQVTVLCNCALLTEGVDIPSVSCIALAKPTRSSSAYTQMVGRGVRLHPGKSDCLVLDFADIYKKCSLVTLPSLLGLPPSLNLQGTDVVKAAETLEELQDKYTGADLSGLTDITKVKAYIESIDLFAAPYTEEVKEYSKLSWMCRTDSSYVLSIPERKEIADAKQYSRFLHEKLIVAVNDLGEHELSITTKETERKLGTYNTLQEALSSADDVVSRCRADRLKLLLRDAPWHHYPASEAAKKMLRSRTKKRPIFHCVCAGVQSAPVCPTCGKQTGLTAGQASLALNILHTK